MTSQPPVLLDPLLRPEIENFLNGSTGRLAQVWEGYQGGEKPVVMAKNGRAANPAAAGNLVVTIETLLGQHLSHELTSIDRKRI